MSKLYKDLDAFITANKVNGKHFFDRDAMRFFRSKVYEPLYSGPNGQFFVESRQFVDSKGVKWPREYQVYECGEFGATDKRAEELKSKAQAVKLAMELAGLTESK